MNNLKKISKKLFSGAGRKRPADKDDSSDGDNGFGYNGKATVTRKPSARKVSKRTNDDPASQQRDLTEENNDAEILSTKQGEKPKRKHHSKMYCPWCFRFLTDVKLHMKTRCPQRYQHLGETDAVDKAMEDEQVTLKSFINNMCISPLELEDKAYSKSEVLELFRKYGHVIVPQEFNAFSPPTRVRSRLVPKPPPSGDQNKKDKIPTQPIATSTPKKLTIPLTKPSRSIPLDALELSNDTERTDEVDDGEEKTQEGRQSPPPKPEDPILDVLIETSASDKICALNDCFLEEHVDDGMSDSQTEKIILPINEYDNEHTAFKNTAFHSVSWNEDQEVGLGIFPLDDSPLILRRQKVVPIQDETPIHSPDLTTNQPSVFTVSHDEGLMKSPRTKKNTEPLDDCNPVTPKGRRHVSKPVEELKYVTKRKSLLLDDTGFNDVPQEYSNQDIFIGFERYFHQQKKDKRLISQHIRNVTRSLYWMGQKDFNFKLEMMNITRLQEFFDFLVPKVQPNTLANYLKSLKQWIKYIKHQREEFQSQEAQGVLDHIFFNMGSFSKGNDKTKRTNTRRERVENVMPPTPYECQKILKDAETRALSLMQKENKNRDDVAFINRYIAAFACLKMGNRPGAVTNFKARDYEREIHKDRQTVENRRFMVIGLTEHKTAEQYNAHLILDDFWEKFFSDYITLVREPIRKRTGSEATEFILQYNGEKFEKVTDGLRKLQKQYCAKRIILPGDARKCYETYTQNLPKDTQEKMTQYLCHTADVRDRCYRTADKNNMVMMYMLQEDMGTFYEGNESTAMPSSFPSSTPKTKLGKEQRDNDEELLNNRTSHKQRKESQTVATTTESQTDDFTSPESDSPVHETDSNVTENNIERIVDIILKDLRHSNNGSLVLVDIPTQNEIVEKHSITTDIGHKVRRRLRYFKLKDELEEIARTMVTKEAKKRNVKEHQVQIPQLQVESNEFKKVVEKVCGTKTGGKKSEQHRIIDGKNKATIIMNMKKIISEKKVVVTDMTDNEIVDHIEKQDWPNCVPGRDPQKGRVLFAGVQSIPAGTIVCDYHGEHVTKQIGEQRLQNIEKDEDANYILFYKHPTTGKRMCVDATTIPCCCHKQLKSGTIGRLISHSAKNPNLKPTARLIKNTVHILLIAANDIEANTELQFDYGVRHNVLGERLDFLQK